ncbi:MAG: PKD domain-containing protein [Flavobacteriales bacterium]|nr:PKD domain-containing protein [Flavobacteriales bacterium]
MRSTLPFLLFFSISLGPLSAQTWAPVGSGTTSAVYALEVFNGELYAGGTFTQIGDATSNYIARWNGSTWGNVANLISFMAADGLYATDTALFIGDGGRVRFWNGTNLFNLTGVNSSSFSSSVYSLAHYQDTLYVGGFFSTPFAHVAKWTGSAYESVTSGCNAQVSSLLPFQDQLFVAGNFQYAGDSLVRHTARWNGSAWNPMGAGVNNDVFAHCIFQDTLYIGGRFTTANGMPASRVAKWNGSQWVKVGGTLNDYVTAMAVYRDQLYIGGAFTTPSHIARLSGGSWVPVGTGCNDNVRTMEVYHDSLFVGGSFTTAGGVPALRIAKWHIPEAPVASFSVGTPTLCPNECTTFTDNSPNGVSSRTWSFPGGTPASSTDSMPTVCYSLPGTYAVTLSATNAGGSTTFTDTAAVTVDICSGIETPSTNAAFSVRPNPAYGLIEVRYPSMRSAEDATLLIMDAMGRAVVRHRFTGASMTVNVSDLPAGLYLVCMESAPERARQWLVIE